MTLYNELIPKQQRCIKRDIDLIFSLKGITFPSTIDDLRELGVFSPKVKVKEKDIYISKDGKQSLRRICDLVSQTKKYSVTLNYNDIYQGIISEIERWLNRSLIPDAREFIEPLDSLLERKIDIFTFFCRIDGLSLDGVDFLTIGNKKIMYYQPEILSGVKCSSEKITEVIDKEYGGFLVIIGHERGSASVAQEKFFYNSELTLSVLRMYSCALYVPAIRNVKIHLINNCSSAFGPASSVGWASMNKDLIFRRYFRLEQDFKLNADILDNLRKSCFYDELSLLIEKENRNEIEESIVKSIYWFGEAQQDKSVASAWIKLWACVECFFSLNTEKITEANAMGISSLLVYGGYRHEQYSEYEELKRKIKTFYDLRSKAVHRAEYTHIEKIQLEEFSFIVASVIIVTVSLLQKGYKNLSQIRMQAERLDGITKSNNQIQPT